MQISASKSAQPSVTAAGSSSIGVDLIRSATFSQGDPAEAVFYVQTGKVKIVVVSEHWKEAVVAVLGAGAFLGEGCLIAQPLRLV